MVKPSVCAFLFVLSYSCLPYSCLGLLQHRRSIAAASPGSTCSFSQPPMGFLHYPRSLYAEPSTSEQTEISTGNKYDREDVSNELYLSQPTRGGYSVKQRLREEIESPFRKVRLVFFASSTGSALTALYFSALNTIKAVAGGYSDTPPLDECLTSDAINIGAAVICAFLAYREYNVGEKNLERIARGGKLASLVVETAADDETGTGRRQRRQLASYRRHSRVLIAAGGQDYISRLSRSLNADQLKDTNIIPSKLAEVDVLVVPVLLVKDRKISMGDAKSFWKNVAADPDGGDRNFDPSRSDSVVAFPVGYGQWMDYLASEVDTALQQGFDVLEKGITLTVKKNGRILRRATGLPPWCDLIGTMEVLDGSRFGMPGDTERYGGS
jgi:Low psii accumulation1 / Rep27